MSDLARLPSYPSPTTLIARSGIQFLDFGFDPVRLRVREWGFHDAAASKAVDDLVQLDFDEVRGQYEVVESGRCVVVVGGCGRGGELDHGLTHGTQTACGANPAKSAISSALSPEN